MPGIEAAAASYNASVIKNRERTLHFNAYSYCLAAPSPLLMSLRFFWRNQSITAGVIFPAADATAQLFDKSKGGEESSASGGASWDFSRTLRWLFFGFAVQAPWNHVSWSLFLRQYHCCVDKYSLQCSLLYREPRRENRFARRGVCRCVYTEGCFPATLSRRTARSAPMCSTHSPGGSNTTAIHHHDHHCNCCSFLISFSRCICNEGYLPATPVTLRKFLHRW